MAVTYWSPSVSASISSSDDNSVTITATLTVFGPAGHYYRVSSSTPNYSLSIGGQSVSGRGATNSGHSNSVVWRTFSARIPKSESAKNITISASIWGSERSSDRIEYVNDIVFSGSTSTTKQVPALPLVPVEVTFDAGMNGGLIGTSPTKVITGYKNKSIQFPNAIKEGYRLLGWSINREATIDYISGNTVVLTTNLFYRDGNKNKTTFYAIFVLDAKIIFYNPSVSGSNYTLLSVPFYNNQLTTTVTIPNLIDFNNQYTPVGWTNSSTSFESIYTPNTNVTFAKPETFISWQGIENIMLMCYGLYDKQIILSFNGNGTDESPTYGEGISPIFGVTRCNIYLENYNTKELEFTVPSIISPDAPSNLPIDVHDYDLFRRKGYIFNTWCLNKEVLPGTETYNPGSTIKLKDNTVLYAIWKKIVHRVIYDPNGGEINFDPAYEDVQWENKINVSNTKEHRCHKLGYSFFGWALNKDSTAVLKELTMPEFINNPNEDPNRNNALTLYAVYGPNIYLNNSVEFSKGNVYMQTSKYPLINTVWKRADVYVYNESLKEWKLSTTAEIIK